MSEADAPGPHNTERSPRRGMCAAVLCLEAITLGLTTPVMITIAEVAVGTALLVGRRAGGGVPAAGRHAAGAVGLRRSARRSRSPRSGSAS